MKKRMFLTTVLMTLVLLLAVTTATFAWYSATSGSTTLNENSKNVETQAGSFQLDGVVFDVEWAVITDQCEEFTDASGNVYYINNGNKVLKPVDADQKYGTAKIASITLASREEGGDNEGLADDVIAALAGTYKITVASTDRVYIAEDTTPWDAEQSVELTVSISTTGVVTLTENTVYFSIRPAYDDTTSVEPNAGTVAGVIKATLMTFVSAD